jgi:SAM-dependent methyltransferase
MTSAPTSSEEFDRVYRFGLTPWGDVRIPPELKELARVGSPKSSLELGCGIGRFSRYMAQAGLRAVGVDFSAVAIDKARQRAAEDAGKPQYLVGNVTALPLQDTFDVSFDVGCFHCLDSAQQIAYVAEARRLLRPGGTHLIWAIDSAPSGVKLTPAVVEHVFAPAFHLASAQKSRRRVIASHWYWLQRAA